MLTGHGMKHPLCSNESGASELFSQQHHCRKSGSPISIILQDHTLQSAKSCAVSHSAETMPDCFWHIHEHLNAVAESVSLQSSMLNAAFAPATAWAQKPKIGLSFARIYAYLPGCTTRIIAEVETERNRALKEAFMIRRYWSKPK